MGLVHMAINLYEVSIMKVFDIKKRLTVIILCLIFCTIFEVNAYSQNDLEVTGTAIILMERSTGRVLYERNADSLIYPASMIKVLTAIIALDYINPNETIRVGSEIYYTPVGSSIAGHVYGEYISGLNLIRALLLPSGNDSSNIVVANVARIVSGQNLPFNEAELLFTNLMNERALGIGIKYSNFTNAHGFHDPNMQATVRELAMIADYAINNPIIRQIASEITFVGNSLPWADDIMLTSEFNWHNTNRLLAGEFHNPDITGLKTGFHTPAGWCLIATGSRNGIELISVIAGSYANERWVDTTALFNYAFNNYNIETVHLASNTITEIYIHNPRWGDPGSAEVLGSRDFSYYLTEDELNLIASNIVFFEDLMYIDYYGNALSFIAPFSTGDIIGEIIYTLNGQELFRDNIMIQEDILEWSYLASFVFIANYLIENPFSIFGLSFILGLIFLGIVIYKVLSLISAFNIKRAKLRNISRPKFKYK